MQIGYRLRQLYAAVTARVSVVEQAEAARVLSAAEYALFRRMPTRDQRHALDVYATLVRAGHSDALLLRAALLHDIGKVDDHGRALPLIYYGLCVVLRRLLPGLYWGAAIDGRGPLRPFRLHAGHARRGASMLLAAGSPPELADIVRHSSDDHPRGQAALLRWADAQH